jgi:hypothetical protein
LVEAELSKVAEGSRDEASDCGIEFGLDEGWVGGCEVSERRRAASVEAFSRIRSRLFVVSYYFFWASLGEN